MSTARDYTPIYVGEGRRRRLVLPDWLTAMGDDYRAALSKALLDHGEIDELDKDQRRARSEAARDKAQPLLDAYERELKKYQNGARASNP